MTNCADCGATVTKSKINGHWASRITLTDGHPAWDFCCRTETQDGKLISADYHYVEGEEQRHWRISENYADE